MMKPGSEGRLTSKSMSWNTVLCDSLQIEHSNKDLGSGVEGLDPKLATTSTVLTLDLLHNLSELLPCPHL